MKAIEYLAAILEKCPHLLFNTYFNLPTFTNRLKLRLRENIYLDLTICYIQKNARHHRTFMITLDNVTFCGKPQPIYMLLLIDLIYLTIYIICILV